MASDPAYCPKTSPVEQGRVYQFVRSILTKVVSFRLLGSSHNWQIFLSNVRRYITAGRGRSFTLSDLMQSMKTNHCHWMRHLNSLPLQTSLLARLVKWLFASFIKLLIRQHFYVTGTVIINSDYLILIAV